MLSFNLIVLSVQDIEKSKNFYSCLGLNFIQEQHGNSPMHYACNLNDIVLELYPSSNNFPIEKSVRLGFSVKNLKDTKKILLKNNIKLIDQDNLIIIEDPDGRKVFITQEMQ